MSTNFPTSLDSYTTKASSDTISESHINDPQDAIEALEAKVGVDGSAVVTSHDWMINAGLALFLQKRSRFVYNGGATAYTVKAGAGFYFVKDKVGKWVSELTTTAIGSPSADTRYYLYLDYSAITSWTNITNSELIWSSTAPTYSHTYGGWYNGDDLCILGVLTDETPSNIYEFFHDGGNLVFYADILAAGQSSITDYDFSQIDVDTTWKDVYLPIPAFSTKAIATFRGQVGTTDTNYASWRTNGQTGTTGHVLYKMRTASNGPTDPATTTDVMTDSSQVIEVKHTASDSATMVVNVGGWYFPAGM